MSMKFSGLEPKVIHVIFFQIGQVQGYRKRCNKCLRRLLGSLLGGEGSGRLLGPFPTWSVCGWSITQPLAVVVLERPMKAE